MDSSITETEIAVETEIDRELRLQALPCNEATSLGHPRVESQRFLDKNFDPLEFY